MEIIDGTLLIKTHEKYIQISIEDILFLKSSGNYSRIYLIDKSELLVCGTIKIFEKRLLPEGFMRIHNSILINKSKINSFCSKHRTIEINSQNLPISKRKYNTILLILFLNRIPDIKKS